MVINRTYSRYGVVWGIALTLLAFGNGCSGDAGNNGSLAEIAFYSNRDGNAEIYLMNADGRNQRRITDTSTNERCPAWSPDGKMLAFTSDEVDENPGDCFPDCRTEVFVMNADGTGRRQLTSIGLSVSHPSWSPNGEQIAFSAKTEEDFEIFVTNVDGSGLRQMSDNDFDEKYPVWSPDGSRIALYDVVNDNYGISVMDADGGNRRVLLNTPDWDLFPQWSPDGSKIVFFANHGIPLNHRNVYVMDADGSNVIQLTDTKAVDEDGTWSPDGKEIAFQSSRDGNYEIYVMNADGSNQRRLTRHEGGDYWPDWRPKQSD